MSLSNSERREVIKDSIGDRESGTYRDYEQRRDKFVDTIFAPVDLLTGDNPKQTAAEQQEVYDNLRARNG